MTESQQETGYLYTVDPDEQPHPIMGPTDNHGRPLTAHAARALVQKYIDS